MMSLLLNFVMTFSLLYEREITYHVYNEFLPSNGFKLVSYRITYYLSELEREPPTVYSSGLTRLVKCYIHIYFNSITSEIYTC